MINPMEMTGRSVLVTGASSGIGRATCILLSQLGARVILVARDRGRLEETLAAMDGGDHILKDVDLSDTESIPNWFDEIRQQTGPLDGLVHCAGIVTEVPARIISTAFFEKHMKINLYAAGILIKCFQRNGNFNPAGSSIVLLSSISALVGMTGNSVYSASKGALISMGRALAMELVSKKIRINSITPALVNTEMYQAYLTKITDEIKQDAISKHPLGIGEPIDVANAIAFLLADTGKWITGTTLVVDGGFSAD